MIYEIAIQHDDKIVAAGISRLSDSDFALARYNTDGSLDSTFSDDGILTTDFAATNDYALALDIQQDGKIVVVGRISSVALTLQWHGTFQHHLRLLQWMTVTPLRKTQL